MKAQIAISILMAFSITESYAQGTDVKVELPKRERNVNNFYHDPPQIQVFDTSPTIRVFPANQPDNNLIIRLAPRRSAQPITTVISAPASAAPPSSALKIGNFETNFPLSRHESLHLPPGQSSRVLPELPRLADSVQPQHFVPKGSKGGDSGKSDYCSSAGTMLRYAPGDVAYGDRRTVKTSVAGTLKPGDLLKAH